MFTLRYLATKVEAYCETAIAVAWQFAHKFVGKTLVSET
jgi:hypothetical protein